MKPSTYTTALETLHCKAKSNLAASQSHSVKAFAVQTHVEYRRRSTRFSFFAVFAFVFVLWPLTGNPCAILCRLYPPNPNIANSSSSNIPKPKDRLYRQDPPSSAIRSHLSLMLYIRRHTPPQIRLDLQLIHRIHTILSPWF